MTALDGLLRRNVMAVGFAMIVASAGAVAQESTNPGALAEVLVTATKRTETLQDVPISVGVVTGETIEKYGLMGFEDIQNYVPNLLVHETLGSYQVRIRGLGSGASQLSFVSAVGIFVDGVYCGRPRCFQEPLFDVERIEVVRGPQGALFGKNTIAGAVSTNSARPTEEFDAKVSAGAELAEGGYNVSGYLSGPLSDTLTGRLAFKREDLDGYIKNISTGKDENATETLLFRGTLEWKPSENFTLIARAEQGARDIDGYTAQLIGYGGYGVRYFPGEPMAGQLIPFSQPETADDETSTRSIFPEGQYDNTDSGNYSLNMDWKVGEYTLTSITGFTEFDFKRRSTATAFTELFVDTEISEVYDQFSQEVRLTSPQGGLFDFVTGVYYSEDDSQIAQWSPFSVPFNTVLSTGIRSYRGKGDSLSAYFSGTFHFADDRARVILGLRYGEDSLDGNSQLVNGTFDRVNNVFVPLPANFTFIAPGASNQEFNISSSRSEDYTLPSINLQFDATEDVMVYASYAEGFKGGGFLANDGTVGNNVLAEVARTTVNGVSSWAQTYAGVPTITPATLLSGITLAQDNGIYDYRPEEATSYELGAKMDLAGGTVRWNLALFYTDFTDLQTSQYDGVRFITRNAAAAISRGIESEFDWLVSENLTLSLDAAYLDAYYDEYKNTFCKVIALDGTQAVPSCTNGFGDLSGEQLERAPKVEATLGANWESDLTETLKLVVNGTVYYSDDYYIQANVSPLYRQDAFFKYDLRVAVAADDERWEVALVGRNLSDELTLQHAFLVGRYSAASLSTPRFVTLQGTLRF